MNIKPAEEKYHSSAEKYQEELGPKKARKILQELGCDDSIRERVEFLIGHQR
jgi:hypothetical protein